MVLVALQPLTHLPPTVIFFLGRLQFCLYVNESTVVSQNSLHPWLWRVEKGYGFSEEWGGGNELSLGGLASHCLGRDLTCQVAF